MRRLTMMATALPLLTAACAHTNKANAAPVARAPSLDGAQTLQIARAGSQPSRPLGPAENFTGAVRVHPLFQAKAPARASGAAVTFEPGARSAWHSHPLGQVLYVTEGVGRVQRWGDPVEELREGDVVWIPPGQKHWHEVSSDSRMTHVAVSEHLEGKYAIAPPAIMARRAAALRAAGTPTEFRQYPNVGHGFGPGVDTSAEGWLGEAIDFWARFLAITDTVRTPTHGAAKP